MEATTQGRRERKRDVTHQLLRSAALRLGAERGLQKVTVEEIAEAADVSVRTFYDHFPSKENAIVGFDARRVDELRDALAARPASDAPLEALREVLREFLAETADEWRLRMEVVKANPAVLTGMLSSFAVYERAMIEVIAARTGTDANSDLYPALVVAVASAAFRSAVHAWRAAAQVRPLAEAFDEAFDLVAGGLTPPPSRTRRTRGR